MDKFIEITSKNDEIIIINVSYIKYVDRIGKRIIVHLDGTTPFEVKETLSEIRTSLNLPIIKNDTRQE